MNGDAIMVLLILGIAATAAAWIMIVREHRSLSARSITSGVILRLNPGYVPSSDGIEGHGCFNSDMIYGPDIVFRTAEGQRIQFTAADQTWQAGLKRGMQVRVAYRPDQPYEPRLVTYRQCFSNKHNLVLVGLFLLYIGLGYLVGPVIMEAVYR
jgi:hypothetical protein